MKSKKNCPVCRAIRIGYSKPYAHECYTNNPFKTRRYEANGGTITIGAVGGGLSVEAVARIFARPNGPRVIEVGSA